MTSLDATMSTCLYMFKDDDTHKPEVVDNASQLRARQWRNYNFWGPCKHSLWTLVHLRTSNASLNRRFGPLV